MKAFRLIGMALVAMCLYMNFASCSNEDMVAPEDPQEEKYVTVGLGCTGEFLEFSNSPLSRTTAEELYGIQVYSLTPVYMHDDPETNEPVYSYESTPYAYGMFTSLNDVTIRLLEGTKYKFEVAIAINPFKLDNYYWFQDDYSEYNSTYGKEFAYSSELGLFVNDVCHGAYDLSKIPYDRYYGELDSYIPEENGSVDIYTKRVVYGVKYETTGLDIDETLKIEVSTSTSSNIYSVEVGSDSYEGIYAFLHTYYAWKGLEIWNETTGEWVYENYTSDKKLTITWNKADGTAVPMGTYNVTFKRNVMTTIKIKAENLNMDNGIKVYKEEVAMVPDENIYEIEGGKVTEVPVTSGN